MATRTIAVMEDVYERLKALKAPNESFSDELRRLTSSRGNLLDLAGAWKDLSDEDSARIHDAIEQGRQGTRLKEIAEHFKE